MIPIAERSGAINLLKIEITDISLFRLGRRGLG
jgi:hypothetical protein